MTDRKHLAPCAVYLQGEYGIEDLFIGVPVILGKNGVERIIELELTEDEQKQLLAERGGRPQGRRGSQHLLQAELTDGRRPEPAGQ